MRSLTTRSPVDCSTTLMAMAALLLGCGVASSADAGAADAGFTSVASVTVSPGSATLSPGETLTFTATHRSATGDVVTSEAVTWSSTDPSVATVSPAGVATGVDAGTATIRAQTPGPAGVFGEATVVVRGPATSTGFANEPAGFVLRGEWKNASALVANGWYDDGNPSAFGSKTRVTAGYSGTPSLGGPAVIQTFYLGGVEGGHDPGRMQFSLPAGTRELFFGIEVQYKADYPTSTSSGGNKQFFVTFTGGGRYFVNFDNGLAQGKWGLYQQSSPLADSTLGVSLGQWIAVEWYLKKDTGAGDGLMRLWIDGVLAIERTDLTFPAGDMVLAYDDGSNNGNHYPLATDPRKIGRDLGGPVDAYRWVSVLRVSTPP